MEHWNDLSNITVQDFNITAPLIKSQIVMTRILVLTYIYKVGDFKQVDYELHPTRSQIMHETGELGTVRLLHSRPSGNSVPRANGDP